MVFRFGDCRLDEATRQLTRNEQEQRLSKKAYALLMLLLGARPRVVAKQEIMDAIWPDTFVSEANIAVLIAEVREALGDAARDSTTIRSHSGVGYSFVADVVEAVRGADVSTHRSWPVLVIGDRRMVLSGNVSTVGRDESCDVCIPHPSVSRLHARIVVEDTQAHIEDAKSKNGVWVNGCRVSGRALLPNGASVRIGAVDASFAYGDGDAGSTWSPGL
jgi:DNA-binding winged helix-turn-helix (wHTH) protein